MGSKTYPTPADVRAALYAQLTEQIGHLLHKWKPKFEGDEEWKTEASK
jgi:hypothetical protein